MLQVFLTTYSIQNSMGDEVKKSLSVILATFNDVQYLRRSLDSLIKQDYPYLEIICVDDGSTDNSS